jgi:hyperosmotically inducible protein
MTLARSLAVLLLVATFCGAAAAQARSGLDDEKIFVAVEQALQDARALGTARITVQSRDGFVTLGGSAPTVAQIAAAGRIASRVRGVTGVQNEIRIRERPSHG